MEGNNLVRSLVVAFIAVMALYFVVWFFASSAVISNAEEAYAQEEEDFAPRTEYLTIQGEREVPSTNKVIIHERFVGDFDKDGSVVAISEDGQAYNVASGVVLADDMVISANDESYSVYRVDDPEKSVSSN